MDMDSAKLEGMAAVKQSGLTISRTKFHFVLLPSAIGNINAGVDEELKSRLYHFDKDFNGILVKFEDVKIDRDASGEIDDDGNVHMTVKLKTYIFRPAAGIVTSATVADFLDRQLSCIVFGHIGVTVHIKKTDEDFDRISLGSEVSIRLRHEFQNVDRKFVADYVSLIHTPDPSALLDDPEAEADIKPDVKNESSFRSSNEAEDNKDVLKKKKKKVKLETEMDQTEHDVSSAMNDSLTPSGQEGKKKKKKKKRELEETKPEDENSTMIKVENVKVENEENVAPR